MSPTLIDLDTQAVAQVFTFGGATAGTDANVTVKKGALATSATILTCEASASVGGNLVVSGNLTVVGSYSEQSVVNLLVTNKEIRVNVGGTTAGASTLAGVYVEGDTAATIGAIVYDATKASKWTVGNGSTQLEVVDVASTQTLTGKSITASQINSGTLGITVGVGQGGTGSTTFTAGIVVSSGGATSLTTISAPTGTVVGTSDTQTLTNKTITSPRISGALLDSAGNSMLAFTATATAVNGFNITNAVAGTNPSFAVIGSDVNIGLNLVSKGTGSVQANGVNLVDISSTQTITGKSISGSQINSGTLGITVNVPQGGTGATTFTAGYLVSPGGTGALTTVAGPSGALVGTTDVQTLTNKTLTSPRIGASLLDTSGNALLNVTATASAVNFLTLANAATAGNPSLTAGGSDVNVGINFFTKGTGLFNINGVQAVDISSAQTLTNKSISGSQINSGTLGITVGVGQGGTGATTFTAGILVSSGGTGAITTVAAPTSAVVGVSDAQTLTNKTLTSPRIGTSILDTSGNALFNLTATASAVNAVTYANAATGTNPTFSATGTDTNIGLNFLTKGSGIVSINGVQVVDLSSAQTITGKSINASQINSGILGITVNVPQGGTGVVTTTAYGVLTGGATATGAFQNAGTGTTGQVLVSNGAAALPTWQTTGTATFRRTTFAGTQNAVNTAFTIGNTLTTGTDAVFKNGVLLVGGGVDYTLSGTSLTLVVAPKATAVFIVMGVY